MADKTYEVRVAGVIPEQDLLDLGALAFKTERANTVLYGDIPDQAALYGLLARLRDLGLEVVEVRQVADLAPLPSDPDRPKDAGEPQ